MYREKEEYMINNGISEIQSAAMATFALSDLMGQRQKCNAPPAVAESSRFIAILVSSMKLGYTL